MCYVSVEQLDLLCWSDNFTAKKHWHSDLYKLSTFTLRLPYKQWKVFSLFTTVNTHDSCFLDNEWEISKRYINKTESLMTLNENHFKEENVLFFFPIYNTLILLM